MMMMVNDVDNGDVDRDDYDEKQQKTHVIILKFYQNLVSHVFSFASLFYKSFQ